MGVHRDGPDGSQRAVPLEQIRVHERAGAGGDEAPAGGGTSAAGHTDRVASRDIGMSGATARASFSDPISEASDPETGTAERVAGAAPLETEGDSSPGWGERAADRGTGPRSAPHREGARVRPFIASSGVCNTDHNPARPGPEYANALYACVPRRCAELNFGGDTPWRTIAIVM